ncbi:MAG: rhodanese-like domain-containing protein [Mycobacteriales bacterium]
MQPTAPEMTPAEAYRRAVAGEVLLLDVREDEEWAAGRAAEAVHLPLSRLDPTAVPADRPVVAVCRVGGRSAAAASALAARGVEVANLTGGMQAWAAAGLPVVRDAGAPGEII